MTPKGYVTLALTVLVALALWKGGQAIYDAGVAAERAVWLEAQAKADKEQRAKQDRDQIASDGVSDETRESAQKDSRETREQTTSTIETIRYVYRSQPAAVCSPDPVPDGVREALGAAYDAAAAASR